MLKEAIERKMAGNTAIKLEAMHADVQDLRRDISILHQKVVDFTDLAKRMKSPLESIVMVTAKVIGSALLQQGRK